MTWKSGYSPRRFFLSAKQMLAMDSDFFFAFLSCIVKLTHSVPPGFPILLVDSASLFSVFLPIFPEPQKMVCYDFLGKKNITRQTIVLTYIRKKMEFQAFLVVWLSAVEYARFHQNCSQDLESEINAAL